MVESSQLDETEDKDADVTLNASLDDTLENDNTENNQQTSSYFSESEESGKYVGNIVKPFRIMVVL